MSYDFGSWWKGGSGTRHYDKNGGYLGKVPNADKNIAKTSDKSGSDKQNSVDMKRFALVEELANGFSKRKLGKYNTYIYFNAEGVQISKDTYEKAAKA